SLPLMYHSHTLFIFLFFNAPATTVIYTLSLHDALPICDAGAVRSAQRPGCGDFRPDGQPGCCGIQQAAGTQSIHSRFTELARFQDRKSTRLNSSHVAISYAVFCLKKKKKKKSVAISMIT